MFGDGVFGPEGVVWCCAIVVAVPAIYSAVFSLGLQVPIVAWYGSGLVTVALAYLIFGYLFGDAVGIIVASITFMGVASSSMFGPRKVVRRVWRVSSPRFNNFVTRFDDSEDDYIEVKPKREG